VPLNFLSEFGATRCYNNGTDCVCQLERPVDKGQLEKRDSSLDQNFRLYIETGIISISLTNRVSVLL